MSIRCLKCFRPLKTCYCSQISPVDPGIKFVFLMHPAEAYKQRTGTGRLASLSLENSEIIIDKTFDNNKRTQELLSDPVYCPLLLYPGKDALSASDINFSSLLDNRVLMVFLLDATWRQARKMIYLSRSLWNLPRISFTREYRSSFTFKRQPEKHCLSTIESAWYLIRELQESGICDPEKDISGLIDVFNSLVQFQINCRTNRFAEREKMMNL